MVCFRFFFCLIVAFTNHPLFLVPGFCRGDEGTDRGGAGLVGAVEFEGSCAINSSRAEWDARRDEVGEEGDREDVREEP